jgi:glucan phosphoethanolaminetransferase (alkaline phosphatase superfamily)
MGDRNIGMRKGFVTAIGFAKIVASAFLLAGTLGLLWHQRELFVHWAHIRQPWFLTLANGWYPVTVKAIQALSVSGLFPTAIYVLVTVLCVLSFFAVPFIGNPYLRILCSVLLVVGVGYDLTIYDIGGELPSFEITDTILSNVGFGLEGTAQLYIGEVGRNVAFVVPILVIFCLRPPKLRMPFTLLPPTIAACATGGVVAVLLATHGGTSLFPSPFASYFNAFKVTKGYAETPVAEADYPASAHSEFRQIVLIVDESVRGDYLSLNNPSLDTTPFLVSERPNIANFGIAATTANCSTDARMALRFGSRESDFGRLIDVLKRLPPFWRYAKLAGLETVYVDAYGSATLLTHDMTREELRLVDDRIIVDDKPQYVRDRVVADKLRRLLSDPKPKFVFVEKFGTHAPYDKMYPPSDDIFGADTSRPFSLTDRPNLVKHYENAIRWSVDTFFSTLLKDGVPPDTLIFYTSDHGQSLSEGTRTTTHCNQGAAANKGEAEVPLFAITGNSKWKAALSNAAEENYGRTSHFEVFPTLLAAMGYDPTWISQRYGLSLLDRIPENRIRHFWATGSISTYDTSDSPGSH